MLGLLNSLMELGNSTSRNLEFAYQKNVHVSFGEETITETNLLELRRRHPQIINLKTFNKQREEPKNGADWEWHIVGSAYTFGMRVQAKRIDCRGRLNTGYASGKTGPLQIDTLISDAKNGLDGDSSKPLHPVYCLYCAEQHRNKWTKPKTLSNPLDQFEYGCLIAGAEKIKEMMPTKFVDVETISVPWHYLVFPGRHLIHRPGLTSGDGKEASSNLTFSHIVELDTRDLDSQTNLVDEDPQRTDSDFGSWGLPPIEEKPRRMPNFPTIEQLNDKNAFDEKPQGIWKTPMDEQIRTDKNQKPQTKLLTIDVRDMGFPSD